MITRLVKIITNTFVVTKLVTKLVMLQCGRCLTPKRFLSPIGDFATSRRDARQLLVGQE